MATIQEDAWLVLEALAAEPREGAFSRFTSADKLQEATGLSEGELADVVEILSNDHLIESDHTLTSRAFSPVRITAYGRSRLQSREPSTTQDSLDHMTQLLLRKAFERDLKKETAAATPSTPTALIMIDIDAFKPINDTLGHPVGDQVIIAVAKQLKSVSRGKGRLYRLGGDEFALLLPNFTSDEALPVAHRIHRAIEEHRIPEIEAAVTVSVGVALADSAATDLYTKADGALYEAKRAGRNKVHLTA